MSDNDLSMLDHPTPHIIIQKWVITLQSDPNSYWNNDSGWGDLMTAQKYDTWEKPNIRLPLQGMWVTWEEASDIYDPEAYA